MDSIGMVLLFGIFVVLPAIVFLGVRRNKRRQLEAKSRYQEEIATEECIGESNGMEETEHLQEERPFLEMQSTQSPQTTLKEDADAVSHHRVPFPKYAYSLMLVGGFIAGLAVIFFWIKGGIAQLDNPKVWAYVIVGCVYLVGFSISIIKNIRMSVQLGDKFIVVNCTV